MKSLAGERMGKGPRLGTGFRQKEEKGPAKAWSVLTGWVLKDEGVLDSRSLGM